MPHFPIENTESRPEQIVCPHCLVSFHDSKTEKSLGEDIDGNWYVNLRTCPACGKFVISLSNASRAGGRMFSCYPRSIARNPLGPEVTGKFLSDYIEACEILHISPKASAALSRRCLQHILREKAGFKEKDLATEIQKVIDSNKLPTYLSDSLDAVRHIGNFAAHPIKSTSTGEVIDVEIGEAEWNLNVIESLFDFYFTAPAVLLRKKAELNAKLVDAGKKPMN